MSETRYHGIFRRRDVDKKSSTPGELYVSDNGELRLEIWGDSGGRGSLSEPNVWIDGELAETKRGPCVTLERCLQTLRRWGPGGGGESWLAHRAFFGADFVEQAATFERVTVTAEGLGAFLGSPPTPTVEEATADATKRLLRIPVGTTPISSHVVGDWTVELGWRAIGSWGEFGSNIIQKPIVLIKLVVPMPVDDILREVTPAFEALLSIARRAHAPITQIAVAEGDDSDSFEVVWPRIDSRRDAEAREPHAFELLFRRGDVDLAKVIEEVRSALRLLPAFFQVFLASERAPSRYVDDRVRSSIIALALLAPAAERLGARDTTGRRSHPDLDNEPFAPPQELLALPALIEGIWGAKLGHALGVDSVAQFVTEIGTSFRWVSYRSGNPIAGRDLVVTHHRIRSLIHVALLRLLGFDATRAEEVVADAVRQYGPLSSRTP